MICCRTESSNPTEMFLTVIISGATLHKSTLIAKIVKPAENIFSRQMQFGWDTHEGTL